MNKKILLLTILLAAGGVAAAAAQQMPPPPHGAGGNVPASEELATLPGASAAQQAEIRKILLARRDAQEDLHNKLRAEFDALHTKERNEHERIDEQASAQLRKLLGDDGYRAYAEWTLARRGPHGGPHAPPGRGGDMHERGEMHERGGPGLPPPPPGQAGGHAPPSDGDED